MNPDRPDDRLTRTLTRKQLDQILDLLDTLDSALRLLPGQTLDATNANHAFRLDLRITRLGIQGVLPFEPAAQPARNGRPPGPRPPLGQPNLKRIHRKILEKASATEPIPAKVLIARAGYKENSYSWGAITYLARHRLLQRTPDGYLLAA